MYEKSILRERLFHGMHQDLQDSIQFCYKKAETTYDELLNETLDAEWEKFTKVKSTSLKIKSAVATPEEGGIKDSKQKIDQLTTVVESSTFAGMDSTQVRIVIKNLQVLIKSGTHHICSWTIQKWTETIPMLQLWGKGA